MFRIKLSEGAADEIARLRAFDRKMIVTAVKSQLVYQPTLARRNRKILRGLHPPWNHLDPVWELRSGEYRVFYDVDEAASVVNIRAVRHKPSHRTTEEIV